MNEGVITIEEITQTIGSAMQEYHLHRLELVGLIEVEEGVITLTDSKRHTVLL